MQVTQLHWGVKESFRRYVEAAGGKIEVLGGVERMADGTFAFPAAPESDLRLVSDGEVEGIGSFLGEVRFEAHGGMLSVKLAKPGLEVAPAGAVLTMADQRGNRLTFANLDLAAAALDDNVLSLPTAITLDGMYVLGDHYPPKTLLDPVRLIFA